MGCDVTAARQGWPRQCRPFICFQFRHFHSLIVGLTRAANVEVNARRKVTGPAAKAVWPVPTEKQLEAKRKTLLPPLETSRKCKHWQHCQIKHYLPITLKPKRHYVSNHHGGIAAITDNNWVLDSIDLCKANDHIIQFLSLSSKVGHIDYKLWNYHFSPRPHYHQRSSLSFSSRTNLDWDRSFPIFGAAAST